MHVIYTVFSYLESIKVSGDSDQQQLVDEIMVQIDKIYKDIKTIRNNKPLDIESNTKEIDDPEQS